MYFTPVVPAITGGLSAEQSSKLQDLLRSVRRPDKDAKMRLAALQWSAALFKHDRFVIETAYLLSGESSPCFILCEHVACCMFNDVFVEKALCQVV